MPTKCAASRSAAPPPSSSWSSFGTRTCLLTTRTAHCLISTPRVGEELVAKGRASVRMYRDPLATAKEWRQRAQSEHLSIRELVIAVSARQSFIGCPATVADQIDELVQSDASDGFILVPHITPGGLDEFADTVVPLLQERGVFRADYEGTTLREHLGLSRPEALRPVVQGGVLRLMHLASASTGGLGGPPVMAVVPLSVARPRAHLVRFRCQSGAA